MSNRIQTIFMSDFAYISAKNYDKKSKKALEEDKNDQYDIVKIKKSHSIKMRLEEFNETEIFDVSDFYEVGLRGKLSIIKRLLQTGDIKLANKLYEEVQRECPSEDRGVIQQFSRNRKLYKNQRRKS